MGLKANQMNNYSQLIPLKRCPFCGGEGYYRTPIHNKGTAFDTMIVECISCGAAPYSICVYENEPDEAKQLAIAKQWNRRI